MDFDLLKSIDLKRVVGEKAQASNLDKTNLIKEYRKMIGFLNHCINICHHNDIKKLITKMKKLNPSNPAKNH